MDDFISAFLAIRPERRRIRVENGVVVAYESSCPTMLRSEANGDGPRRETRAVKRRRTNPRSRTESNKAEEEPDPKRRRRREPSRHETSVAKLGQERIEGATKQQIITLIEKSPPETILELAKISPRIRELVLVAFGEIGERLLRTSDYLDARIRQGMTRYNSELVMLNDKALLDLYVDLEYAMRPESDGNLRLLVHIAMDNELVVLLLLAAVDPTKRDSRSIVVATEEHNNPIIVRALLDWGGGKEQEEIVDPSTSDNQALVNACAKGATEVVELLLDWDRDADGMRVDPRARNAEALFVACRNAHTEVATMLLNWEGTGLLDGLRIDATTENNRALVAACEANAVHIVEYLLNDWFVETDAIQGLEIVSPENRDLATSLVALLQDSLVDIGNASAIYVDPREPDDMALWVAASLGLVDIVAILLAWVGRGGKVAGARVDPTVNENMALETAVKNNHLYVVKELLNWTGSDYLRDKRVDPTMNDYELYDFAKQGKLVDMVAFLEKWEGTGELSGKRGKPPRKRNQEDQKTWKSMRERLNQLQQQRRNRPRNDDESSVSEF